MGSAATEFDYDMTRYEDLKADKLKRDNVKEIIELKAKAYDIIGAIEQLQRELTAVNAEIARKTREQHELNKKYDAGNDSGTH